MTSHRSHPSPSSSRPSRFGRRLSEAPSLADEEWARPTIGDGTSSEDELSTQESRETPLGLDSSFTSSDHDWSGRYDSSYRPEFVEVDAGMVGSSSAPVKSIAPPRFVHLHAHSAYSLLEGAIKVADLVAHASGDDQPAIAVTDTNNLFAALEFSQTAKKAGVQPIVGCQIEVDFGDRRDPRQDVDYSSLVLLAASDEGYANLVALVSRAFLESDSTKRPHVLAAWLDGAVDGIICLTGGDGLPGVTAPDAVHDDAQLSEREGAPSSEAVTPPGGFAFTIYPNPLSGRRIGLTFTGQSPIPRDVTFRDLVTGQVVHVAQLTDVVAGAVELELPGLAPGSYAVTCSSGGHRETQLLTIAR